MEVKSLGRWRVPTPPSSASPVLPAGGALTFKKKPNYEMPADAGGNNEYNVTVVVTDNGVARWLAEAEVFDEKNKMTAKREVIITVTNVNEDGTVTLSAQQPRVGIALTASVEDIDGGVKDITWKWARSTVPWN